MARRGYEELDARDEFKANSSVRRIYDLSPFGVPWIPVVGRAACRRYVFPEAPHVHKGCIEVIYCQSGSCEYESCGKRFVLKSGRIFVSRPDEPHRAIGNPKGYALCYFLFNANPGRTRRSGDDAVASDFAWMAQEFARLPRLLKGDRLTITRFNRLFALAETADLPAQARRVRMRSVVLSLLLGILDATSLSLKGQVSRRIAKVAEEMKAHPEREYSLRDLARRLSLSQSALLSGFKEVLGFPPHAYLVNCRIERAKAALESGVSVKTVAARLNYPSAQHFSASFKDATGMTPGTWRRSKSM